MAVRIAALSVPRFYDGGIDVNAGWSALPKKLTDEQRASLIAHVGRFIQVHPDDVKNLAEHGLKLVDKKLIEATEKNKKPGDKPGDKD